MNQKDKKFAFQIFLFLAALFITSLVVSNLIFQKFFYWKPFGDVTIFGASLFEISVGILPYPITFLITDLISEMFGRKKANQVVTVGIFASFFSMGIILLANYVPALPASPINDETFNQVFALSPIAVLASMIAYLFAQYIDVAIYHFWKKITKGKHLWLRNNFSTFLSQFIDTFTVVGLLCIFKILPWELFSGLVISGFIFKIIIAFIDTPFLYFFVYLLRKRFKLKVGEEINLEY
ncbi:queuosine precursor transporter [Cellulophaga sp. HaHaR_3_176]|uniref:queuosine precursor transporter n=1 Tax=Cellulophaga sp. HaHaR_3_176 TaxID=1942464 RepID=UPI001C1F2BF9|nr:queuosine precursor transporter [Cellulophaga sp. HaHaR_3_176]QWX84108.1 queuosine precursor transporter [Cellulophaga sp. HaHaR_3_176]